MCMKQTAKRLNITLPESTVTLLESVANKGERSTFIDNAIKAYIKQNKQKTLRESLKEGSIARSERDLSLADKWFEIEEELWQK
jgi:CopG family transcriptional regulator / antitoxin EndoAI